MGKRGPKQKHSDQDYVDAIIRLKKRNGWPPTFREIAEELGTIQTGYHSSRIRRLHELGAVTSIPRRPRTLVVLRERV